MIKHDFVYEIPGFSFSIEEIIKDNFDQYVFACDVFK